MNIAKATIDKYNKQYADISFERRGLFELIREHFNPAEVLYPGCSIHLTPAFYFPHVVFIDKNAATQEFFSNHRIILELILQQRKYQRTPHFEFIFQDFTQPLPLGKNQFDLLLSLYTGGITNACKSWLKFGGLLLTNNHQNDAVEASQEQELNLIAVIQKSRDKYRLTTTETGASFKIPQASTHNQRYLRQKNTGVEFIENEQYYLFKRIRPQQ